MKIALVAQNATPLSPRTGSGPESDDIGLGELTRKLADHGHKVTIYAQKQQKDVPDRAELGDGVRVEHIDAGPAVKDGEQADSDLLDRVPAFSGPLRTSWERERPDIIHALRWTSGLAALAASRDRHIPIVQEFSSLGVTEPRGLARVDSSAAAARLRLEPAIGRSAAAVVATHSAEASDLANLGVHRSSIRVVPWGVDTDMFTPEGPVAKRNGRPRLLTAADLTERAELETLLRALTRVPDAELMVVDSSGRAQLPPDAYVGLEKFAAALGIADRVIFSGQVARSAMPALLRSADLVVSTCQYEPSGMTSLQAMACGTPVIAPPVDGHADAVVDGTTGILIPAGRPALLAQRIRQLLAHPMLLEAYGVAAVDRARSRYSWDRIASETLAVYDRAAAVAAA